MKSTSALIPALLGAALAAIAAVPVAAAPDQKPVAIEKRVQVHTGVAGTEMHPMPPPEPVTFLGIEVAPVEETLGAQLKLPPDHGLVVRFVVPDSPAAAAGIQKNDVLVRLDDQLLIAPRQLSALVRSRKEGETVKLAYVRAGAEARANATLTRRAPPPMPATRAFHWFGSDAAPGMPAPGKFMFHLDDDTGPVVVDEGRIIASPPVAAGPHVMIFRPQARIIYKEGDLALEVTSGEKGRQLEARGADGKVIFSGPINTPQERAALPPELLKHLEKLDALEPESFEAPVPPPAAGSAVAPGPTWESAVPAPGGDVLIHAPAPVPAVPAHRDAI